MSLFKKISFSMLIMILSLISVNNVKADALIDAIVSIIGEPQAIPGPGYSPCDFTVSMICVKKGNARVYEDELHTTYTDYIFVWVPSTYALYHDLDGVSVVNVDLVNHTYDVYIDTKPGTLTVTNQYTFQDVIDYYNGISY